MEIVTGRGGSNHVTGADDAAFNAGIVGPSDYLLSNKPLTITRVTTNTIQLSKCEIVMQGIHGRILGSEVLTIPDGSQSEYRIDAVVATYEKASDGIETMTAEIIKGTAKSKESSATAPTLTVGDTYAGATKRQVALAYIHLYESTVNSIEVVIPQMINLETIKANAIMGYKKNQSISVSWTGAGFTLSSGACYFTVPLIKPPVDEVTGITITNPKAVIRVDGNYLCGASGLETVNVTSASLTTSGIKFVVEATSALITTTMTNRAAGINFTCTCKFV